MVTFFLYPGALLTDEVLANVAHYKSISKSNQGGSSMSIIMKISTNHLEKELPAEYLEIEGEATISIVSVLV